MNVRAATALLATAAAIEFLAVDVGRNDPCPCGSGKKFKKCCDEADLRAVPPAQTPAFDPAESFWSERGALERERCPRFLGDLLAAAAMIDDWLGASSEEDALSSFFEAEERYASILENVFGEDAPIDDFLRVRSPFDLEADSSGRSPAALFLDRFRDALPADAIRAVGSLLAGEDALVSVEKQGKQKFLRRFSDDRVLPTERTVGRAGDILLGRLVELADHFCLFNPEKVSGFQAEECLGLEQSLGRAQQELVTAGLISSRKARFALQLATAILLSASSKEESKEEPEQGEGRGEGRRGAPVIVNADGHATVLTISSFQVLDLDRLARELGRPSWRADLEIEQTRDGGIRKLTAVLSRGPKGKRGFLGGDIILATLRADRRTLRLETNSVERDLEVRRHLAKLPAGILRFEKTTSRPIEEELAKTRSERERRRAEKEQEKLVRSPEVRARLAKMFREYSLRWCDTAIPALGNRKPRALVRTEAGRARVLALIEQMESRPEPAGGLGMDLALIRRELGLPSAG